MSRHGGPPLDVPDRSWVWQLITGHAAALAVVGGGGFLALSAVETFSEAPGPAAPVSVASTVDYPPQSTSTSSRQAVEDVSVLEPVPDAATSRRVTGRRGGERTGGSVPQAPSYVDVGSPSTRRGASATLVDPPAAPLASAAPAGSPVPSSPPTAADGPTLEAAEFRLATLNVLGHSHTTAHGNKPGFASGTVRLPRAVQVLSSKGVDLVGFQELEEPQYRAFQRVTDGSWGVFPALTMGRNPVRNSIAWRRDTWSLVSSGTIPVPYFHGNRVPMPWVVLQHVTSHRRLAVVNIHNPVSSARRGDNERWRDLGTALETDLVNRLRGTAPVVLMGDFNERDEAFCTVTSRASMHAANGGSSAPCRPPAGAGIDWIFGTAEVAFSAYERFSSPLLRSATDHPLIVATGRLDG